MGEKEQVKQIVGTGIIHRGNQVDTDAIVPARYLKEVTFDKMGEYVFYDERFDSNGQQLAHKFNEKVYQNAQILFVNQNFGCGSSREHAPQSLMRWGIKALVGESFAKIFSGNCGTLGIPAVTLDKDAILKFMALVEKEPTTEFTLDLESRKISYQDNEFSFDMPKSTLSALVSGEWDSTMMLKSNEARVQKVASALPYVRAFKD